MEQTDWSAENADKSQYTALTDKGMTELKNVVHKVDQVKNDVEILGVCSVGKKGAMTDKENKRISSSLSLFCRAALLPIGRSLKHQLIRTCATSKAVYGWVVGSPNKADNTKHEQMFGQPVQGNPAVKRLLLGPDSSLVRRDGWLRTRDDEVLLEAMTDTINAWWTAQHGAWNASAADGGAAAGSGAADGAAEAAGSSSGRCGRGSERRGFWS
eukprot:s992_g20.t1